MNPKPSVAALVGGALSLLCSESFASASNTAQTSNPIDDNRIIPVHAKICDGGIVNKTKLFFSC